MDTFEIFLIFLLLVNIYFIIIQCYKLKLLFSKIECDVINTKKELYCFKNDSIDNIMISMAVPTEMLHCFPLFIVLAILFSDYFKSYSEETIVLSVMIIMFSIPILGVLNLIGVGRRIVNVHEPLFNCNNEKHKCFDPHIFFLIIMRIYSFICLFANVISVILIVIYFIKEYSPVFLGKIAVF